VSGAMVRFGTDRPVNFCERLTGCSAIERCLYE
jgi:hypothetical protein